VLPCRVYTVDIGWFAQRKRSLNAYTLALFAHVSGAIGYFIAMGVWLFGLAALRRATRADQVRALSDLLGGLGPLFGISVLVILAAGLYMTFTAWGFQTGWIDVAPAPDWRGKPRTAHCLRRWRYARLSRRQPPWPPPVWARSKRPARGRTPRRRSSSSCNVSRRKALASKMSLGCAG
jgi:hypothetical protein